MYINPIEILGLSGASDILSIDNEILKKEKRRLYADIDLSDNGIFEYYGNEVTKGNCEKAIDELSNNDHKEFYLYLSKNKPLNEFLANGNQSLFENFKQDSIFKLPDFINFISPFFAPKFDRALLENFEKNNPIKIKYILNTSTLLAQSDFNNAFKSVTNKIENNIAEIDKLKKEIENELSIYNENNIDEVIDIIKSKVPVETLNCLPPYFQSQKLKIANSINYLSNSIWDAFDNTNVPFNLITYVLTIDITGVDRNTFENNFKIIKNKHTERIEQLENEPLLKKWAQVLLNLRTISTKIDNKELNPKIAIISITEISIQELNELPSFANEIRHSIAFIIRGISVSMWNIYKDNETAIKSIQIAIRINLEESDIAKLNADLSKLNEIKKETEEIGKPIKSVPSLSTVNGIGTTIYGKTVYFVFFGIPILPLSRYNCESTGRGYRFYGKLKLQTWQKIWKFGLTGGLLLLWIITSLINGSSNNSSSYSPPTEVPDVSSYEPENTTVTEETQTPTISAFKGNQLSDGASPLSGCFGQGIYQGNATLTIKNGGNSDAIVCLYSIENDKTIRNEYVQKNSSFTMSNIAQGQYKIRVFYGNDWNPELENSCGTKGNFESDVNFSEFDGSEFFEDSENGYTNATVTLYSVAGGNASSSSIDQSQFFRK
jgi:hypothetical protein